MSDLALIVTAALAAIAILAACATLVHIGRTEDRIARKQRAWLNALEELLDELDNRGHEYGRKHEED